MTVVPRGEKSHHKKRALPLRYVIVFLLLVGFFGVTLVLAYGFIFGHWYKGIMRTLAYIPVPVAEVGGQKILYKDVVELAVVAEHQQKEDPFVQALETLTDRAYMRSLADELGTGVSQEELASYSLDQDQLNEFLNSVKWSLDDYRHYVIEPLLLYQAVGEEVLNSSKHQTVVLAEMENIQENIERGISFTDLAIQYSEHPSASIGGDLGYLAPDQDSELYSAMQMDIGEISGILDIDEFYMIATVYDVLENENGDKTVGIQVIALKKDDLSVIFSEYKKGKKVTLYIR